jgi:hypothetical protein
VNTGERRAWDAVNTGERRAWDAVNTGERRAWDAPHLCGNQQGLAVQGLCPIC